MNINLYFQSVFWLTKRDDCLVASKATTVSSHDSHFEFLQVNVCKLLKSSKIPVFSYDLFWQQQTSTDSSYHSRYQVKLNWWTFKVQITFFNQAEISQSRWIFSRTLASQVSSAVVRDLWKEMGDHWMTKATPSQWALMKYSPGSGRDRYLNYHWAQRLQ